MNPSHADTSHFIELNPAIGIRLFAGLFLICSPFACFLCMLSAVGRIEPLLFEYPTANWLPCAGFALMAWIFLQCQMLKFKMDGEVCEYRGFFGFTKRCPVEEIRGYTVDRQQGSLQIHLFNKRGKIVAFLSPNWFANFGALLPWLETLEELSLIEARKRG